MGDISSGCTIKPVSPTQGLVMIVVQTAATADSGDTVLVTLSSYGISPVGLLSVSGFTQTTVNSVVVPETDTATSVSSGVLTITCGGGPGNTDKVRVYTIIGRSG